jgi:hypothetical protein
MLRNIHQLAVRARIRVPVAIAILARSGAAGYFRPALFRRAPDETRRLILVFHRRLIRIKPVAISEARPCLSFSPFVRIGNDYSLWLDRDTVNPMPMQDMPDAIRHQHVIYTRRDEHMDRSDDGRFRELPDVQLVH